MGPLPAKDADYPKCLRDFQDYLFNFGSFGRPEPRKGCPGQVWQHSPMLHRYVFLNEGKKYPGHVLMLPAEGNRDDDLEFAIAVVGEALAMAWPVRSGFR